MILQTDASNVAVGGILQQKDDNGNLRILGCASSKLTPTQVRWTIAEKELWAIVYCIDYFSYYLKGSHFRIITDHKLLANLKFLLKWERPGRLFRWRMLLLGTSFSVDVVRTHENKASDALTKLDTVSVVTPPPLPSQEELRKAQGADPFYSRVINRLKGNPQHDEDINEYLAHAGKYSINGYSTLLVHSDARASERIVIPPVLRWRVFQHFHDFLKHASADKTYSVMVIKVFWRGMYSDVQDFSKQCAVCQKAKRKPSKALGKLQLFSATRPFQRVGIDLFGPLPETPRKNKFVLVIQDAFTRWVEYIPCADMKSETVANLYFENVICRFGCPETILSDRGSSFLSSEFFAALNRRLGSVRLARTSSYSASTNGACERSNAFLAAAMRSYVDQETQNDWDLYCPAIAFAARASVVRNTGFSAFFLAMGRNPILPVDLLYSRKEREAKTESEYAEATAKMLKSAFKSANEVQKRADAAKKEYFDRKKNDFQFKVGDLVNIFTPRGKLGLSYKLTQKNTGPFKIIQVMSPVHYKVEPGRKNDPYQIVNIRRLMPHYSEPKDPYIEYEKNLQNSPNVAVPDASVPNPVDDPPNLSDAPPPSTGVQTPPSNVQLPEQSDAPPSVVPLPPTAPRTRKSRSVAVTKSLEPIIIDSIPGESGDCVSYLLRVGDEQFWVSKEEVSTTLLKSYERTRRSKRAAQRSATLHK